MLNNLSTFSSKKQDLKNFFLRLLFFTPLALIFLLDSILPIDFFNHRVWESLCVMRPNRVLTGFFYPQKHLIKYEAASDLDYYRGESVRKTNEWTTDRYGYRKQEPYPLPVTVAVIGDSNVAGSGMTQKSLFSEVLEKELGTGVYPLAPGGIESVFYAPFFKKRMPQMVIAAFIERNLTLMGRYDVSMQRQFFSHIPFLRRLDISLSDAILGCPLLLQGAVFVDRFFYKKTLAQYLKVKLFGKPRMQLSSAQEADLPELLFFQGDYANRDFPESVLETTAETVKSYQIACGKQGIRFIFMPIPNKENIYYDFLPGKTEPVFLQKLIRRVREKGVEAVDLQEAYEAFRKQHPKQLLFDPEEAHWNPSGVRVAAEAVMKHLREVSAKSAG